MPPTFRPSALAVVGVLLALASLGLVARAGKDERGLARELVATRGWRLVPVTAEQVRSYPARGPEQAFAEFWRDLQLGDAAGAWLRLGRTAKTSLARNTIVGLGDNSAKIGLPPDLRARVRGNRATIDLEIVVAQPIREARYLGPRRWAPRVPLIVELRRRRGRWLITRARGSIGASEVPADVLP